VTQTVAITGASAGIGRTAARLFAQRGDRVGLIARGHAGLEGAARDVEQAGGSALAVPADVADLPRGDDYGAHGEFDGRSHPRSAQLLLSHHPVAAVAARAATAAVGAALASRARKSR
jgi:NAD(P)-dependent dehydrogenase (short-subunit alcohol dehydrogenase family)